ncbi:class I SAM-dependent methyltransferase [Actinacidiphila bryophytorum]|uniref:Methyltransferase domain-containing protein n=1 Tax=Actinacidiphila bryophytorum TaxID=1436133 RepID=A0A9W4H5X1_9ACTN|nr:class I SAM-dependent methyltransferase [Actinacidiphila bryophytorum]MBM9439640.1 class I SAM-dependent methyltransferase [Actinacidiphila bryophytorum]MBN6543006.1 class I SAM-dependent methyltransferase [Actinacidiphila bryophytorum]CAG7653199.1 Methyltransferase domain-containing protein [Actinacidiphila bryophytorum]
MLDYDVEAARYDATRGGVPRAVAAARAVLALIPDRCRTLLDVGCGTGLVTERLVRPGLQVFGVDAATGMVRTAADRVGGRVVKGNCHRLPFADESLDAVSAVWLLHLLPDALTVVAECARVLRPGGVFVTTVDKDAGHDVNSDVDQLMAPYRVRRPYDGALRVTAAASEHGLRRVGEARFTGHGQGRSPNRTAGDVSRGYFASALALDEAQTAALAGRLSGLPDPDVPRGDPVYRLLALGKTG